jgi:hypothetical protein
MRVVEETILSISELFFFTGGSAFFSGVEKELEGMS